MVAQIREWWPVPTEEQLADHAAQVLTDAAAIYRAAGEHAETFVDFVGIITASLNECVDRARGISARYDPRFGATDQATVHENMRTCLATIAAASLALTPLYAALGTYWQRQAERGN